MAAIAHDHHDRQPAAAGPCHLILVPAPRPRPLAAAVYRRRRLVVAILVAALLAVTVAAASSVVSSLRAGAAAASPAASSPAGPPAAPLAAPIAGRAYLVQPGDTVWSVARRLQPVGEVRPLVDRIVAANGGPSLHPGQVLALP